MFVILSDKSKAVSNSKDNLCPKCWDYHAIKYSLDDQEERICTTISGYPIRLRGPVSVCSSFHDKTKPTKHEMDKMAWVIEPKKDHGFKIVPPSQRKNLDKD